MERIYIIFLKLVGFICRSLSIKKRNSKKKINNFNLLARSRAESFNFCQERNYNIYYFIIYK